MKRLFVAASLLVAACGDLAHDGPFDPSAPLEKQAKAEVYGVVALEGETDAAGVNVQLQSATRTYDVDTGADGSFRLTGVVPGTYQLRVGTRYFEELNETLTVTLGEAVDLGSRTLALRKAAVRGSALVEALVDGATAQRGDVTVTLTKTSSVRSASGAPFLPASLRAAAAEVEVYTTRADGEGDFQINDVTAGNYDLEAGSEGAASVHVEVQVTGEDGDVTIEPVTVTRVSGTFSIEATAGGVASLVYSSSTTVGLTFVQLGAATIEIGESVDGTSDGCSFKPAVDAVASTTYTLGGAGRRYVCVRFADADGNRSDTVVKSIFVDGDAPGGSIAINGGAAFATVAGAGVLTLTATDAGSGVASVKLAALGGNADCAAALSSAAAEAYTGTRAITIPDVDGQDLTYCALFGDAAANWMAAPVSDSVYVDTVAPSGASLVIEDGATYATSQMVTLTLAVTGATEMRLANGSSVNGAPWEPFRASATWFLPVGVGTKEVSVQFRDAAGNLSATAADTIYLDNDPPASPALTVSNANAAGYVTTPTAQLALFAVGATQMQISRDGFFDTEPFEPYATASTAYLSGGDGVKLLYVRFLDDAGNTSSVVAASVVLDTELPQTGFMRIDDGAAWTTDSAGDVELSFTATGADEVAVGQGGCPTAGWQPYETRVAYTITGGDAPAITLFARFRDRAGNTTSCINASIGLDRTLNAPLFAAAVTGEEGVPGQTALLRAWVTLSGITPDVAYMQVDDDSAFGGAVWRPVTSKFVVPLTKGDGTKTVYVKIRDLAGNESAASSPFIELDQTGPESPSLVVTDYTGDGHAVTEAGVELVWSKPTDTWSFSLERFVLGVDGFFNEIASGIPAATMAYTDDVTATVGKTHLYRVRALDRLGNASSYSVAVAAYPFAPVRRVYKVNTSQGFRYFFTPESGTYALRPTYTYQTVDNDTVQEALVENTVEWVRPLPSADVYNEALNLRASNQDGSLVYDTIVPLGHNLREKVTFDNRGWQQRLAADVTGAVHVVHSNFSGLNYLTNKSGAWTRTIWNDGTWPTSDRHPSVAVDSTGAPHIAFYGDSRPRYKTYNGAAWSDEVIDAATNTGTYTDIAVDRSDLPNVVYYDETKKDLKFAKRSGSWVTQAVDTAGDVGKFARIALDSGGKAHVVYYDATNDALKYATNRTGSWVTSTLDTALGGWSLYWYATSRGAAGVVVGLDDQPRVAYAKGTTIYLKTWDGVSTWTTEVVVPTIVASFTALTLDRGGNPVLAYFDETTYDLMIARKEGTWVTHPIHTAADPGRYVSIGSDGLGDLHLAYSDDGAESGYTRFVAPRVPTIIDDTGDAGFGGAAAVGPRDTVYLADWNRTSKKLVFRTNKNGPWETTVVTTSTFTPGDTNRLGLVVRPIGSAHLIYKDPDVGGLRYWLRSNAGNWTTSFIDTGSNTGDYAFLAMDPATNVLWASYRAYNGSNWETRVASRTGNNPWSAPVTLDTFGYAGTYNNPIGFKPDGTIVVYSQYLGHWWEKGPLASIFTQNTTDYGSIYDAVFVFDGNGKIHAASRDPGADVLIYSTNKSGAWVSETVSQSGLPGADTKITLDPQGSVHIVYYDTEYQAVRYATNATGAWINVTLDSGPKVGRFLSAFLDSGNHAQVFYYDEINGALKNLYDFSGWINPSSVSLTTTF